jgi:hypothetical protein
METLSSVLGMAQYKPTDRSVNQFFELDQKGLERRMSIRCFIPQF